MVNDWVRQNAIYHSVFLSNLSRYLSKNDMSINKYCIVYSSSINQKKIYRPNGKSHLWERAVKVWFTAK